MNLPKIIGDVFEDEVSMVCSSVDLLDYDNYKKWFDSTIPIYKSANETPKIPLKSNRFALVKRTLESLFRERERISLEQTNEYIGEYWIDPTIKKNMATFLVVYQDFYREDEDFKAQLWQNTVDYFKITNEDMKYARNGWVPEWVKEEK